MHRASLTCDRAEEQVAALSLNACVDCGQARSAASAASIASSKAPTKKWATDIAVQCAWPDISSGLRRCECSRCSMAVSRAPRYARTIPLAHHARAPFGLSESDCLDQRQAVIFPIGKSSDRAPCHPQGLRIRSPILGSKSGEPQCLFDQRVRERKPEDRLNLVTPRRQTVGGGERWIELNRPV